MTLSFLSSLIEIDAHSQNFFYALIEMDEWKVDGATLYLR